MIAVLLTIHVLIVLGLIGVVLLQRSEGGALGMGGGGGGGGFMTGRGAANALTRTTSVLAALFFSTSLALALIGKRGESEASVLKELTSGGGAAAVETAPAPDLSTDDLLNSFGADSGNAPAEESAPPADVSAPAEAPAGETGDSPAVEDAAPANDGAAQPEAQPEATPEEPKN